MSVGNIEAGRPALDKIRRPAGVAQTLLGKCTPQAALPFAILWQVEVSTSKACTVGLLCTKC